MEIYKIIDKSLKESINRNYELENYTGSITDAIIHLSEVIRDKTGLEGDGASLIGSAFGGQPPKIKLNNLQTESEKNIQRGIQDILRGIYTGIRNPRSHDKVSDSKDDADSIILFINYLLKLIDKSRLSFEEGEFLERIFDEHYVADIEYSKLLVAEIPPRQRVDIGISVVLQRKRGDSDYLKYFIDSLFEILEDEEIERVYEVISDKLKCNSDFDDIKTILQILPSKYWTKIDKSVRIRVENIILMDFKKSDYSHWTGSFKSHGNLATVLDLKMVESTDFVNRFINTAVEKLEKGDVHDKDYVYKYFWDQLYELNRHNIRYELKNYIKTSLQDNDLYLFNKIKEKIEFNEEHVWWKEFEDELLLYQEIKV